MPREGTETVSSYFIGNFRLLFGNKMPREGTETCADFCPHKNLVVLFGNKMPREGTETILIIDKTE